MSRTQVSFILQSFSPSGVLWCPHPIPGSFHGWGRAQVPLPGTYGHFKYLSLKRSTTTLFSFIESRERGREGEREQEKHWCCSCPDWGLNPQPSRVLCLGTKLATLRFAGRCSIRWATPVKALLPFWFSFLPIQILSTLRAQKSMWEWMYSSKLCILGPVLGFLSSVQHSLLNHPSPEGMSKESLHCPFTWSP